MKKFRLECVNTVYAEWETSDLATMGANCRAMVLSPNCHLRIMMETKEGYWQIADIALGYR
jgi:hypothetical protein